MNEMKHISTSDLVVELLDRHGLRLRGFGCFYHILQGLSKTWNCVASDYDRVVTTVFNFEDGSSLAVSEKRETIVEWCGKFRHITCFDARVEDDKLTQKAKKGNHNDRKQ